MGGHFVPWTEAVRRIIFQDWHGVISMYVTFYVFSFLLRVVSNFPEVRPERGSTAAGEADGKGGGDEKEPAWRKVSSVGLDICLIAVGALVQAYFRCDRCDQRQIVIALFLVTVLALLAATIMMFSDRNPGKYLLGIGWWLEVHIPAGIGLGAVVVAMAASGG